MENVSYWYHGQVRRIILSTLRVFSNFCVSVGKDKDGNNILRKVPVTFMSTDKSALYQMNNATDTIIETCPKMILTLTDIKPNNDKGYSAPYYPYETEFTEKRFDDETGEYVYDVGETYSITRLNPIPIGLTFKLYILTTMQTHKFQLFEQIRTLFSPTLELQTSENPLDWSRLTALTLTGINYSSNGTNLDSKTLDSMDMTFEIDTNLDAPAVVEKSNVIETIVTNMYADYTAEDIYGWDFNEAMRTYFTPHKSSIVVKNNQVVLKPGSYSNWYKLFTAYGMKYNTLLNNTYLHCKTNGKEIYGQISIDPNDEMKLLWNIERSTLPIPTLQDVDMIIDPHNYIPNDIQVGTRYLLLEGIGKTNAWGDILDGKGEILEKIDANTIIEYNGENWILKLDPSRTPAQHIVYVKDTENYIEWDDEFQQWVDVINGEYHEGYWRLSQQ